MIASADGTAIVVMSPRRNHYRRSTATNMGVGILPTHDWFITRRFLAAIRSIADLEQRLLF